MVFDGRSGSEDLRAIDSQAGGIRPQHIGHRHGMGGRGYVSEVEQCHVGGMVKNHRQLPGEQIEFFVGEVESSQTGDMSHVVASQPRGVHDQDARATPGPPRTSPAKATTRSSINGASQSRVAT